jgi:hypothetical protein
MAVTITWVKARQIFISRGNPTVEVRLFCFVESSRGRKFGFASFLFLFRSKAQPSFIRNQKFYRLPVSRFSASMCSRPPHLRFCILRWIWTDCAVHLRVGGRGPQRWQLHEGAYPSAHPLYDCQRQNLIYLLALESDIPIRTHFLGCLGVLFFIGY